jgi:hypothetical protein
MNKKFAALAVAASIANPVYAEIQFNGFSTIMAGMTLDDDTKLYGFENEIDFRTGSLFGLQGKADLSDGLSATVQIIGRGKNNFDPKIEWAYISYEMTDELTANLGKIRLPFYKYSEFLDVGYAFTWTRTPRSVYDTLFSTAEGIRLDYQTTLGDFDSSMQFVYGNYNDFLEAADANARVDDIMGFSWELTYDWLSIRAAHFESTATVELNSIKPLTGAVNAQGMGGALVLASLNPQLAPFSQQLISIINDIEFVEDSGTFSALGFAINKESLSIVGEYTLLKIDDTVVPEGTNYYLSAAYQFDEITPYVVYEHSEEESHTNPFTTASYQTLAQLLPPELTLGVAAAFAQDTELDRYTVGLRWDFNPSAAFKIEYHTVDNKLYDVDDINLISTSIDVVF